MSGSSPCTVSTEFECDKVGKTLPSGFRDFTSSHLRPNSGLVVDLPDGGGNQVTVGTGVRGNTTFANRQNLQMAMDQRLIDLSLDPDNSFPTADAVTSCLQVDADVQTGSWCQIWKNVGHADMSDVTTVSSRSIQPQKHARQDLADPDASNQYISVGRNANMRMSREPVYFDATDTSMTTSGPFHKPVSNAALALQKNFYALHKQWGGASAEPCCGACNSETSDTEYPLDTPGMANASESSKEWSGCATSGKGKCSVDSHEGWWNGGTRKENIYFAMRQTTPDKPKEQVLCLRMQGDLTAIATDRDEAESTSETTQGTLGLPGLGRKVNLGKSDVHRKLWEGTNSGATWVDRDPTQYEKWRWGGGYTDADKANASNKFTKAMQQWEDTKSTSTEYQDTPVFDPTKPIETAFLIPMNKGGCETCVVYPVDAPTARRVGSCIVSADNFGSGLYEVFARIPPGNNQEYGGMGYVFASWTFHYSENYTTSKGKSQDDPLQQRMDDNLAFNPRYYPHMELLGNRQNRFSCGLFSLNCDSSTSQCPETDGSKNPWCQLNDGAYTLWNHEIDIEIPTNSKRVPQVNTASNAANRPDGSTIPSDPTNKGAGTCTWMSDTINFNTWLSDDQDYWDASPYRNVGVRRMDQGTWNEGDMTTPCSEPRPGAPPSSGQTGPSCIDTSGKSSFISQSRGDFHWYGFIWHTGSDAISSQCEETSDALYKPPFIDFYFDRHFVQRVWDLFIPSRASKITIGPWFGWWGGIPTFGASEVWIKHVNIVPFAMITDPFLNAGQRKWAEDGHGIQCALDQINASYLEGTATQDQTYPPLAFVSDDLIYATNDINAVQLYDQCGRSRVRNVCDYNAFLVSNQDVDEAVIGPGLVLGGPEPSDKCTNAVLGYITEAQKINVAQVPRYTEEQLKAKGVPATEFGNYLSLSTPIVVTNPYVSGTADRKAYYNTIPDPDPHVEDRIRHFFVKPFYGENDSEATLVSRGTTSIGDCQGGPINQRVPTRPSKPPSSNPPSKSPSLHPNKLSSSSSSELLDLTQIPRPGTVRASLVNPRMHEVETDAQGGTTELSDTTVMWIVLGAVLGFLLILGGVIWVNGRRDRMR